MGRAHFIAVRYGSEVSTLVVPRKLDPAKRIVLYAHGAGGDGRDVCDGVNKAAVMAHVNAWADAGLLVLASDFGGPQTFGNDTELTAAETIVSWAFASGMCATDKVVFTGSSMGTFSALRYALAHPTLVAGISTFMAAVDIEDIRTRDAQSARANINTAWGLPVGSYIGGADQTPVPTRGKPLDPANATAVAGIPTHFWYSTADTVATSTAIDAYAAARANVTKHIVSTSLGHVDATIAAASTADTTSLLQSWSS